jgi:flavin-dependent dehydrogenase
MAFDPLSSQGIYKALHTGLQAAEAVHECISGDVEALLRYATQLDDNFDRYLAVRSHYYMREMRWPDSLFWQRRQRPSDYQKERIKVKEDLAYTPVRPGMVSKRVANAYTL